MKKSDFLIPVATAIWLTVGWLAPATPAMAADDELVVFDWAGYEDPEFFRGYIERHGDSPAFAFFGDEEEAFQKLRAGFRADVAHPCSQSIIKWRDAGLIEPIDTDRLVNWDGVIEGFRDMPGFVVDGEQYVVPVDWGSTGLTFRTDKVDAADAATLQSFANPKYQGRISLPDNVDDVYALGFLVNGVKDWTQASDADFEAASAFLRRVHPNVRAYWQDGAELGQLMTSGEVLVAWAWSETPTTLQAAGVPVAMNRDTREGASTWVCGYVDLANGPGSEDKVYDFLNAWLESRTAEYLVTAWGYGHSNGDAMEAMGAEALEESGFGSLDSYRENTLWQAPIPSDLREKMIAEFEKIKAGF